MTWSILEIVDEQAAKESDPQKKVMLKVSKEKMSEYLRKSRLYRWLYYTTRSLAVLSAAVLPFTIGPSPLLATALSILVAVMTAIDMVFAPKDRWVLYSKANDVLGLQVLKALGMYDASKDLLEHITQTETERVANLPGMNELLGQIRAGQKGAS